MIRTGAEIQIKNQIILPGIYFMSGKNHGLSGCKGKGKIK
jgi:hypothetical protein